MTDTVYTQWPPIEEEFVRLVEQTFSSKGAAAAWAYAHKHGAGTRVALKKAASNRLMATLAIHQNDKTSYDQFSQAMFNALDCSDEDAYQLIRDHANWMARRGGFIFANAEMMLIPTDPKLREPHERHADDLIRQVIRLLESGFGNGGFSEAADALTLLNEEARACETANLQYLHNIRYWLVLALFAARRSAEAVPLADTIWGGTPDELIGVDPKPSRHTQARTLVKLRFTFARYLAARYAIHKYRLKK